VLLAASWTSSVWAEESKPNADGHHPDHVADGTAAQHDKPGGASEHHPAQGGSGGAPQEHDKKQPSGADAHKPSADHHASPAAEAGQHHPEGDHHQAATGGHEHKEPPQQHHGDGKPGVEEEFEVHNPHEHDEQDWEREEHDDVEHAVHPEHEEDDDFVDEWDHSMEGFLPELLLTFNLPGRKEEYFYEDVPAGAPTLIRGGFFATAQEEESQVEVLILDPKGNKIYERNSAAEGLFHFLATEPGTYTFSISNANWMTEKSVMFTMGKGNSTHLQPHHVSSLEDRVKSIDKALMDVQAESTYLWMRAKSHMKAIENIHNRVFAFCLVEFLVLLGVSSFQVYYIKGLLSDKRVL